MRERGSERASGTCGVVEGKRRTDLLPADVRRKGVLWGLLVACLKFVMVARRIPGSSAETKRGVIVDKLHEMEMQLSHLCANSMYDIVY